MRLAKLSEFRRLVYTPDSAPSERTLRARIRAGKVPGGKLDAGHYCVDLDAYDSATRLRRGLAERLSELERDPLLADLT